MKNKEYWIEWARRAGIRAVKTIAQAAIAGIGTAAVMSQVDIKYVISVSLLAGVLSLLTSVAGLPEISNTETAKGE
ncbi:MAG: holin [Muricomes sp.]|nr:holin [Muricomes sp.]